MQTDILIVGQGLAGSLLAWELIRRGTDVVVVDNGDENASLIAAGIINPITGKRWVKAADIETLLPASQLCYSQLSALFRQEFYRSKPLFKVFSSQEELAQCVKRQDDAAYTPYLDQLKSPGLEMAVFFAPFGMIAQKQSGHLLVKPLLTRLKQFFIDSNGYRQCKFDYQEIRFEGAWQWQGISAVRIIFCEGYQGWQNPWFSWLPFKPAKGEILTLNHQEELPDAILNYGNWLLPVSSGVAHIGATFEREPFENGPSENGRTVLLNNLATINPGLARAPVTAHQAGIRPCTMDRQPFLGRHPKYDNIYIFNGFGAKGSLQIPWYSQRFADYLLNDIPLPTTCDIQRYQASHFPG